MKGSLNGAFLLQYNMVIMKNIYLITAIISLITIGCTKSDPSTVSAETTAISANVEGTQTSVNITSNTEWSSTSSETWVMITPANGKGNGILNVQVQANKKTESRNATITVITKDGAASCSITVSQMGLVAKMDVSPESISAEESSVLTSATITSNTEWRASSSEAWVQISPATGEGNGVLNIQIQENKDFKERTATISVITLDGNAKGTINVSQKGVKPVLEVNTTSLNMTPDAKDKKSFDIISNCEWNISNCPDWLSLSALSGKGNATIEVQTNSFNNSPEGRSAKLLIKSNIDSKAVEVSITQAAGLVSNCNVEVQNVVVLSDAVAFNFKYGAAVSYYYVGYMEASEIGRLTDDEIIHILDTEFTRNTPADRYVISFPGLKENTDYFIYTIAFNKNGNRGELLRKDIRTGVSRNEPFVTISNVKINSNTNRWEWDTTPSGYTYQYYMWPMSGKYSELIYINDSDALVAWFFKNNIKNYPTEFKAIDRGGRWSYPKDDAYFQLVTWGTNRDGSFSDVINNQKYRATSSNVASQINNNARSKTPKMIAVRESDFDKLKIEQIVKISE